MPIVIFQILIITSMIITRVFAKDRVIVVAGIWTAFTLFMVFMPWLMIIQLIVIWTSFAFLSPKDDKASGNDSKQA